MLPALLLISMNGDIAAVGMFVACVATLTPLIVKLTEEAAALIVIPKLTKLVLAAVDVFVVVLVEDDAVLQVHWPEFRLSEYAK